MYGDKHGEARRGPWFGALEQVVPRANLIACNRDGGNLDRNDSSIDVGGDVRTVLRAGGRPPPAAQAQKAEGRIGQDICIVVAERRDGGAVVLIKRRPDMFREGTPAKAGEFGTRGTFRTREEIP